MSRDNYLERIAERVKEVREKPIDGDSERKHKWYMKNRDRILAMAKDVKIAHDEEKYLTSDKSIKIIAEHLYNAGYRKVVEQSETARECQEGVDNGFSSSVTESATRAKVAEEIFAEIEEKIDFNLSMISKIAAAKGGRANGKTILWAKHDVYTEMKEDIAELKKKYIGKDTNVTTNTEEGK